MTFFPETARPGSGLGTTLIRDLVAQLEGEIRLFDGLRTRTSIVLDARHFNITAEHESRSRSIRPAVVSAGATP
jgi:hypothetical protein